VTGAYPLSDSERSEWILARRPTRNQLDPRRPFAFFVEEEHTDAGDVIRSSTIFLTNRECPWRCLMCDLWKNTLTETVPLGAIPAQIDFALESLGNDGATPRQIKLYNSGSFFDPRAIPSADYPAIAERVAHFERVIVECHPALVNNRVVQFREMLGDTNLEVAMGLETVHSEVLPRLNKRMTLEDFASAARFLRDNAIALRVFVLVKPPFITNEDEALHWACRSIDFAFDQGATAVSLIPTRFGNGALEALAEQGAFSPPRLGTLEAALDYGIGLGRGRVFADLWDLEKFSECDACFSSRRDRLRGINLEQSPACPIKCSQCGARS